MARFDLTEGEWSIIAPLLPNKPRGKPRQDDRRVLNGIFYTRRTGSPWLDLPERYGPCTTCYRWCIVVHPQTIRKTFRGVPGSASATCGEAEPPLRGHFFCIVSPCMASWPGLPCPMASFFMTSVF